MGTSLGGVFGSALGTITQGADTSSAFTSGLQAAGEQGIQSEIQNNEANLALQQQEDAANTAFQLAAQQEKDNAQNAQKAIGDIT